ncbi:MAG: NAD-dependent epimerase/dehydratase family protein [Acidimicrobiales bacterium]
MTEKPILVTGAAGFIGANLVAALAAAGRPVRALVRDQASAQRLESALRLAPRRPELRLAPPAANLGLALNSTNGAGSGPAGAVEVVFGDVRIPAGLAPSARGVAAVIHLAGSYRGTAEELQATHVGGTANLLGSLDPGTRVVYVSSTSVYGWDQAWPADETNPPRPVSPYGRAKLTAESLVNDWQGGATVIARPTIVYGPGDQVGMVPRCLRLLARRGMRFPGTGVNRIHLIHVDDVVSGLMALVDGGEGVFVLAGPQAAPLRRILTVLARAADLPRPGFGLPAGLLGAAGSGLESAWEALGRHGEPPLTRHGVEVATRDRAYSSQRAQTQLGWRPVVDLDEGLAATAQWVRTQPVPGRSGADDGPSPGPGSGSTSRLKVVSGNARSDRAALGFDWRSYLDDPDEGLGTVYERFALDDVLTDAVKRTGAASVLHAPLFGMMGFPGLDAVNLARAGVRVGLLDYDAERLEAVTNTWIELGLEPEVHLVDGPDARCWPHRLDASYDLVFSFAALWWFDDPWAVLAAQARWADQGVLTCVPNKNVFLRMRAALWHRDLFDDLNAEALDRQKLLTAAAGLGLEPVGTGLFDIPPFPDTSIPLAKVVKALLPGKKGPSPAAGPTPAAPGGQAGAGGADEATEGVWAWSILPYLKGLDPTLPDRVAKLAQWERFLPGPLAPGLAHHRYTLFVPSTQPTATPTIAPRR